MSIEVKKMKLPGGARVAVLVLAAGMITEEKQ